MPEPRLATHMLVSSLIRRASAQGDIATVIRKGDPTAGALLLITRIRGNILSLYEQFPTLDGARIWQSIRLQAVESQEKLDQYLEQRGHRDPDLWVLELDVAFDERLAPYLASGA